MQRSASATAASACLSQAEMSAQSRKRSFDVLSQTGDDHSGSTKRHVKGRLTSTPVAIFLQPDALAIENQPSGDPLPAEALYDYPGLEEDMSSLFNHTSSFHRSFSGLGDVIASHDLRVPTTKDLESAFDEMTKVPLSSDSKSQVTSSRSQKDSNSDLRCLSPDGRKLHSASHCIKDEDTLEEEVDWDGIMESIKPFPIPTSASAPSSTETLEVSPRSLGLGSSRSNVPVQSPLSSTRPQPPVTGLLLRPSKTFFRISEMLARKTELFKKQPKAVFELFARLIYTSRNQGYCKQFFQLSDLLVQTPPYISGTLVN